VGVNPQTLAVSIDELVLDGVAPDDPAVREAVARALDPVLGEHGLGNATASVTAEVTGAVGRELRS